MNHASTFFFVQLKWKWIPFPFHLHTTLCGRRANAPAIFSTKSLGRARIPMPKETTTTPASAASTQRRRPCGQNTHSCLEVLVQKGPSHSCLCQWKAGHREDEVKSTWSTKLCGFHHSMNSKTAVIFAPSQGKTTWALAGLGSLQGGVQNLHFIALSPALEVTQLLWQERFWKQRGHRETITAEKEFGIKRGRLFSHYH